MDEEYEDIYTFPQGSVIADRYEIVELVGAGGMGAVYLVRDRSLSGKEVALKALHPEHIGEKTYVERFIREIELMNQVNHPNVVRTFDIGTDDDIIYFTMEFVHGTSLEQILDYGSFPVQDVPQLMIQILDGLDAIHKAEIIHRDLKPGNILLLDSGVLKITDFGVARPRVSQLTRKNERVGSIWYMAPEVWQGKELTKAADLYSLGILMYEAITGDVPFEGDSAGELMQQHLGVKPIAPKRLKPDLPAWLEGIILRLLEKEPENRPQTAAEVKRMVERKSPDSSGKHPVEEPSKSKTGLSSAGELQRYRSSGDTKKIRSPKSKSSKKSKRPKKSLDLSAYLLIAAAVVAALVVLFKFFL